MWFYRATLSVFSGSRDKQKQISVKIFTFLHVASEMFLHGDLIFEQNFFFPLVTVATVKYTFPMTRQQRQHSLYKRLKKPAPQALKTLVFLCLFSI